MWNRLKKYAGAKTVQAVALVVLWGILNTGAYLYLVNIRSINPDIVSPLLSIASILLAFGVAFGSLVKERFAAGAWLRTAGPITLAVLGVATCRGISFLVWPVLIVCAAALVVRAQREHGWLDEKRFFLAMIFAQIGAVAPIIGWEVEGASDDVISFLLPFVPAFGAIALAFWLAPRQRDFMAMIVHGHSRSSLA